MEPTRAVIKSKDFIDAYGKNVFGQCVISFGIYLYPLAGNKYHFVSEMFIKFSFI